MKKIVKNIIIIFILLFIICIFSTPIDERKGYRKITEELHIDTSRCKILINEDSHGFHGDGETYIVLNCQDNPLKLKDWKKIKEAKNISNKLTKKEMQSIEEGFYYYVNTFNRFYDNGIDIHEETSNYVNNYLIAMYDTQNNHLYYYEFDS